MDSQIDVPKQSRKPKLKFWIILFIVLLLIEIVVSSFLFLQNRQSPKLFDIRKFFTKNTPTPTETPTISFGDMAFTFIKDGAMYKADYNGTTDKIFDMQAEESKMPQDLLMKLSPDKNYAAYVGINDGKASAIKIIDISQKKKVLQKVYDTGNIADFAWSPDSKKFVVAVNVTNGQKNFTPFLYVIDLSNKTEDPILKNKKSGNTEITQTGWLDEQYIYYSAVMYGGGTEEQFTAVFRIALNDKRREYIDNDSKISEYPDISAFTSGFLVSQDKKTMLAFEEMKNASERSRGDNYTLTTISLPEFVRQTNFLNAVLPKDAQWYDNSIVGIKESDGSKDSSIVLLSIPQEKSTLSLLDIGPRGSFHSIQLVKKNGQPVLVVWSELDGKQTITAYDLNQLIAKRKISQTSDPLWQIADASSLNQ